MTGFRLVALDPQPYAAWFGLDDERLRELGAVRQRADESPGYPCRASLEDAAVGEELLLFPFVHQPSTSGYRASGPIFVRRDVPRRTLDVGEIPGSFAHRLISVRGYDADHAMVDADVCDGTAVAAELARQFANPVVAYAHLHYARRGCFACAVHRA